MTATDARTSGTSGPVAAGDVELWVEQRGEGPDVLLIAGLSDPAEAWAPQLDGLADRYRLTAFDNAARGGRRCHPRTSQWAASPMTPPPCCVRSGCPPPTSPASRAAAPPPKSWRYAIPSWSGASCSSARGPVPMPTSAL
jgi:hypothetical protein